MAEYTTKHAYKIENVKGNTTRSKKKFNYKAIQI